VLTEYQKVVYDLYYIAGLRHWEIAERLNRTPTAIRSTLKAAERRVEMDNKYKDDTWGKPC